MMNEKLKSLSEFWRARPAWMWALPLLAFLDVCAYGHVLLSGEVLSHRHEDLAVGIWGIDFVFGELRRGNLPLWNPYILCGTPCFASFQTMVLYPIAWMFLVLPPGLGCNLFIIFHVFWVGAGMFWWLSRRGLHPFSCVVGAALLMFGATTTLKIYAGHITVLSAMSWTPFLLVACDAIIASRARRDLLKWVLMGMGCVALQIAAGFPQHVFYSAAICSFYVLARLLAAREYSVRARLTSCGAFGLMYFGGALLMMMQLLASWQASKETARAAALPFRFIGLSSFPPENLLTLFSPTLFGGVDELSYWGRWYAWEATLYIGVIGLVLAALGLASTHAPARRARWLFAVCAALMLWLALGKYTPLLHFLYAHVPVFGSFRSSARALFQASIFLCALAALGFDALWKKQFDARRMRAFAQGAMVCGVLLAALALWSASAGALPLWRAILKAVGDSGDYFVRPDTYNQAALLENAPIVAMRSLLLSAVLCAGAGVLLHWSKFARAATGVLGIAAILEVVIYAAWIMPSFPYGYGSQPAVAAFLKAHAGDARFIKTDFNNLALRWRACDMGGYESFRLRRFDEWAQWAQDKTPDHFPTMISFAQTRQARNRRAFDMMRCRYFIDSDTMKITTFPHALPHALLVSRWKVRPNRDAIFAAMRDKNFDPRREAILESAPGIRAQPSTSPGTASVQVLDSDTLELTADAKSPALLLVTDSYSKDWKATGLPDSAQREYSVMPANYILRAIPLSAGHHHIRMEYSPPAFRIGKWISLCALALYFVACAWVFGAKQNRKSTHAAVG